MLDVQTVFFSIRHRHSQDNQRKGNKKPRFQGFFFDDGYNKINLRSDEQE